MDGYAAVPRHQRPHRAQLCVHAGRLHHAAHRTALRDGPDGHLRSSRLADRRDRARHRVRQRGRRRHLAEPPCADAHRTDRCLVPRRRVLRERNALRADGRQDHLSVPAAARGHRQRARIPVEPTRLRPHAARRAGADAGVARPDAVAAADHVGDRRPACGVVGRQEPDAARPRAAARRHHQMVRRTLVDAHRRVIARRRRSASRCAAQPDREPAT